MVSLYHIYNSRWSDVSDNFYTVVFVRKDCCVMLSATC